MCRPWQAVLRLARVDMARLLHGEPSLRHDGLSRNFVPCGAHGVRAAARRPTWLREGLGSAGALGF